MQEFSIFKAPITAPENQTPVGNFDLSSIYFYLRSQEAKEITEKFRKLSPELRKERKVKMFSAATFTGTFSGRSDKDQLTDSGFLCIDIDHLHEQSKLYTQDLKELLTEDIYLDARLIFVSPSGDGLKVVVSRPEGFSHIEYFKALQNYFRATYGIEIDSTGKNISRLCFLPYDFDAFYYDSPHHSIEPEELERWKATYSAPAAEDPAGALDATSGTGDTTAKDPREKAGIVGAFCRCYSIPKAIERYLLDKYSRTGSPYRYTYIGGHAYGGLVVFQGGYMAYSHHETDPAGGRACNAFDLVRIHLFGNDSGGPDSESFKKMAELAEKDPKVRQSIAEKDFSGIVEQGTFVGVPSTAIPSDLIKGLYKIDFEKKAEELGKYPGAKTTQKVLLVVIVRELLRQAQEQGAGLCCCNNIPYLYAGGYWHELGNDATQDFLTKGAIQLGMKPSEALHFEEQDNLFKQFKATARKLPPRRKPDQVLINFLNGTLDIENGKIKALRPSKRADFLRYQLPYNYDPGASCPRFLQYLNRVLPDESAQMVLAEFVGNALAPGLKLQKALVLLGNGNNGKSVFCEVVTALLGRENVSSYTMESLTAKDSRSRAQLETKLLNYCGENSLKLGVEAFKTLVRNEPIEVRRLYGESYMIENYARIMFNCNVLPVNVEQSEGFYRSFLIIPFRERISDTERDPELAKKIIAEELPGIFIWVLEGLQRLIKAKKYTECEAAAQELDRYKKDSNSVLSYLEEQEVLPSSTQKQPLKVLYAFYKDFCNTSGHKFIVNIKTFSNTLRTEGYHIKREAPGNMVYCSFPNN